MSKAMVHTAVSELRKKRRDQPLPRGILGGSRIRLVRRSVTVQATVPQHSGKQRRTHLRMSQENGTFRPSYYCKNICPTNERLLPARRLARVVLSYGCHCIRRRLAPCLIHQSRTTECSATCIPWRW